MTSSLYNGVGQYTGPVDTIGPYLTTATLPQQFLLNALTQEKGKTVAGAQNIDDFLAQYSELKPMPQDIDSFAQQFAQFYNLQAVYGSLSAATAQVKNDIISSNESAIQTNNTNGQNADYNPLITPVGTQIPPAESTINEDIATRSFNSFLQTFNYTTTDPSTVVTSSQFSSNWQNYYIGLANVRNDYRYIFDAFFANNTQSNGFTGFENALSGFIKNIMYSSTSGTNAAFLPGQDYSAWFVQMQQQYSLSLYGSSSNVETSIGPSVEKARILDTIFDLIVKMIGTLQIVTAAQSDRLQFLTEWQKAYTDLQNQIRSFIKNGPETIQGNDDIRNQLNQLNQTYTTQVQSRRQVISDDAKALQTNINQSSDEANQQTSLATAIIQEFSTILSAIYR